MKRPAPLTTRQQQFVAAYIALPNAVQAYLSVYPNATYRAAAVQAHRLLKKPNIRAEIAAARRAHARRAQVGADKTLKEIAAVAFSDIGDLFDDDGRLLPPRRVPQHARRAITSVKVRGARSALRARTDDDVEQVGEQVVEYKFANKLAALGELCDYLGLSTTIPPLEALLAALPPALAAHVREALAAETMARPK